MTYVAILVAGGVLVAIFAIMAYGAAKAKAGRERERRQHLQEPEEARERFDEKVNKPLSDDDLLDRLSDDR